MPDGEQKPNGINGVMGQAWRAARRLVVLVIGSTVVLIGVIMIVTPGPAFVLIPAGIAILATEFVWARRLLQRARRQMSDVAARMSNGESADDPRAPWHRRLMDRLARACQPKPGTERDDDAPVHKEQPL
jgi:hypothetical protein